MPYRCAMLGCGGRSRAHGVAYKLITRGKVVAIRDMNEKRLQEYGDMFSIKTRYTNFDEILRLEARSRTNFVVNHQLRHHPKLLELLHQVRDGKIGEVRFIDSSAVVPMAGQGVHVLDLMFAFNNYAKAKSVFGTVSGWEDMRATDPAPTARAAHARIGSLRFFTRHHQSNCAIRARASKHMVWDCTARFIKVRVPQTSGRPQASGRLGPSPATTPTRSRAAPTR